MADEQQEQQHETVTTITTERNQHKLLCVGELRFEIDVRSDGPPHCCCCCCYHFMLLLSCNCHWTCANIDESQQQHYIVTTTIKRLMITKVLNNLCRFICMLLLLSHPIFMVLNPIFCYVSPKIVIFHFQVFSLCN